MGYNQRDKPCSSSTSTSLSAVQPDIGWRELWFPPIGSLKFLGIRASKPSIAAIPTWVARRARGCKLSDVVVVGSKGRWAGIGWGAKEKSGVGPGGSVTACQVGGDSGWRSAVAITAVGVQKCRLFTILHQNLPFFVTDYVISLYIIKLLKMFFI